MDAVIGYQLGELVFAKIRGYSKWPGRVDEILKENQKYRIFFFGTYDSGFCTNSQLQRFQVCDIPTDKLQKNSALRRGICELQNEPNKFAASHIIESRNELLGKQKCDVSTADVDLMASQQPTQKKRKEVKSTGPVKRRRRRCEGQGGTLPSRRVALDSRAGPTTRHHLSPATVATEHMDCTASTESLEGPADAPAHVESDSQSADTPEPTTSSPPVCVPAGSHVPVQSSFLLLPDSQEQLEPRYPSIPSPPAVETDVTSVLRRIRPPKLPHRNLECEAPPLVSASPVNTSLATSSQDAALAVCESEPCMESREEEQESMQGNTPIQQNIAVTREQEEKQHKLPILLRRCTEKDTESQPLSSEDYLHNQKQNLINEKDIYDIYLSASQLSNVLASPILKKHVRLEVEHQLLHQHLCTSGAFDTEGEQCEVLPQSMRLLKAEYELKCAAKEVQRLLDAKSLTELSEALDLLNQLPVQPLALKKNPQIIKIVSECRIFDLLSNTDFDSESVENQELFLEIRTKANACLHNFARGLDKPKYDFKLFRWLESENKKIRSNVTPINFPLLTHEPIEKDDDGSQSDSYTG